MDVNNFALTLAKAAFTTSDDGATVLYNHIKMVNFSEEPLKEYVYFKAYIAILKINLLIDKIREDANSGNYNGNVENDIRDLKSAISAVYSILNKAFSNDPLGYGNSVLELKERVQDYNNLLGNGVNFDELFYEYISTAVDYRGVLDYDIINSCQSKAVDYMDKAFGATTRAGASASKNSGCLSVVACTVFFIVGVMCLI